MFNNLRAEMARKELTIQDLADCLGVRYATVCDKLNGKYRFYYDEAKKLKDELFPECDIEYLFAQRKSTA